MTSQTSELVIERVSRRIEGKANGYVTLTVGDLRTLLERLSSSEVTEEMREAGRMTAMVFRSCKPPTSDSELAEHIYLAMRSAATSKEQHP